MKFNYKDELIENRVNGLIKMQMGRQGSIIENNNIKDHVHFLPFLFPNFNNKYKQSQRSYLPQIKTQQVHQILENEATSSRSKKTIQKYKVESDNTNEFEHSLKLRRSKGVSSNSIRMKRDLTRNKLCIKNQIKIYKLSINLYPNHPLPEPRT